MKEDKEPKHTLSTINEERAAAAYAGVCGYESHRLERQGCTASQVNSPADGWDQDELRDTICDLICDLHHLADRYKFNFRHCCETAMDHYENET